MAISTPTRRVLFIGTGGILNDRDRAAHLRDQLLPPTHVPAPTTAVLDLTGLTPTPAALLELVLPLGQRLRGGAYGALKLVIATPDDALLDVIESLAIAHDLPLFLSRSSDAADVAAAVPAGKLTAAERETLAGILDAGGGATAAQVASRLHMSPNAATNRLTNLTRKGYLHRYARPRRQGDMFIDPRVPVERDAEPSSTAPLDLSDEAAERLAALLRRGEEG